MPRDLSLLPYDPAAPRDPDGVPIVIDLKRIPERLAPYVETCRHSAMDTAGPQIIKGSWGSTNAEIERNVSRWLADASTRMRARGLSPEEIQAARLGMRHGIAPFKRTHLEAMAALAQATVAMIKLADGLNAAADFFDLVAQVHPPQRSSGPSSTPQHVLGLGQKRPLRPEDFGALPPRPQP